MDIEWQETFETGNEEIDLQHHYFINLINRIHKELNKTANVEHQERLLNELLKYAEFHFASEENIAFGLKSKGLKRHKERHRELFEETKRHINQLKKGEMTVDEFILYLYSWFVGHTIHEDRKLLIDYDEW